MQTTLLAEYLCHMQPLQVRIRLLCDKSFGEHLGLSNRSVITLFGKSVDIRELFAAARRVLSGNGEQSLEGLEGGTFRVTADANGVLVKSLSDDEQSVEFRFKELLVLSACSEIRQQALDNILQSLGPTTPDFSTLSSLRNVIGGRELNDDEVHHLFYEISNGVVTFQQHMSWAIETKQSKLDNLIPSTLDYFECFCGPSLTHADPEVYFGTELPMYRKELLRRDLVQGLDISLIGALRDDLSPGSWIEQLPDDELWNAFESCNHGRDPFSLLGALDIALGRQHDDRYHTFAEDTMPKLLKDEFLRPDGINIYDLIPLLSEVVLNRINTLEGGALRAPSWKRMCAWMQAGLLSRLTWNFSLEFDRLREWALESQALAGVYANILDLRREPMFAASIMSSNAFRNEIVSRLLLLLSRHEADGRRMPRLKEIQETMTRLSEIGSAGFWWLPGPLEGYRQIEKTQDRKLKKDDARLIMDQLSEQNYQSIWPQLAHISQLFDLSEELLSRTREAISRISLEGEWEKRKTHLGWLIYVGCVAAAQRDIEFSKEIAGKIVTSSHLAATENEVGMYLQTLLFAGAAFEDEGLWAEWIEEQLAEMAWCLPNANTLKALFGHLQELKKVVKLSLCIHARAEAICSSAI